MNSNVIFIMQLLCSIVLVSVIVILEFKTTSTEIHNGELNSAVKDVIFSSVLFRHGARTPWVIFSTDPNRNTTLWKSGLQQLTNEGKNQAFELGKYLRKRYFRLIPESYNADDIYVFSSDVDRTLMSASCHLAGLYPPSVEEVWNSDIPWQPIPVHTFSSSEDNLIRGSRPCTKYKRLYNELLNSEEFNSYKTQRQNLSDYLSDKLNYTVETLIDYEKVNDIFKIESETGLQWPEWLNEEMYNSIKKWAELSLRTQTYTKELIPFKVGVLLNEIITHMRSKIEGQLTQKLWIYSAHDITIINILQTLGLLEPHIPPYSAALMLDLRKIDGQFGVSIHYRNSTSVEPVLMKLKDCDYFCRFERFVKILEPFSRTREKWEEECKD